MWKMPEENSFTSAHWENQPEFEVTPHSNINSWIESLELRLILDNINEPEKDSLLLTILKLKVGPQAREILKGAQVSTYCQATKVLKRLYGNKLSVETAIKRLSMTKIDYSSDRFGNLLRNIGKLIAATVPDLSPSMKLEVISQRLLTVLSGNAQRRLLDRLGFYKSLGEIYVDLEFHNKFKNESNTHKRPSSFKSKNFSSRSDIRCHHCNFPSHKKAQCRRFLAGLPKKDYTIKKKSIKSEQTFDFMNVNNS
ncbi:Hypothetical protein SRAE_0000050000 [Strongyloides ratti]|uniref:Zinc finger, CCHC-type domain-containing protein n=1 Tax=Strongyloides ratti TaxID=34506 RepID=A0A090L1L6_STRRB|nr:Hypothetical protein SRAE_0000050000 [Strongyloides ratti]CEF61374.1 Hypothetical protein SRAE_0000050000 [Strongyloides ratti]